MLLHSNGIIDSNKILENEQSGLCIVSETVVKVENNYIENNGEYGIEIRDPATP